MDQLVVAVRARAAMIAVACLGSLLWSSAKSEPLNQANVSIFGERAQSSSYAIDHAAWDDFMRRAVLDVGFSDRQPARRRSGGVQTGTRLSSGSRTKYRHEGNRVIFREFNDNTVKFINLYRSGLVKAGNSIAPGELTSDEQLAFWLNLYTAVLMEEIAKRHPVTRPGAIRIRERDGARLFDAKLVRMHGIDLSLNDIRYEIVYRYWQDPHVIYGFWEGTIGGPSIQPRAYSAATVWDALKLSGAEYVNALRGVEGRSGTFRVSSVYNRSRALFRDWPNDLYTHLRPLAHQEVDSLLDRPPNNLRFIPYDSAIADLSSGEVRGFSGSDNAAAALSSRGESVNTNLLLDYGAPISDGASRGGLPPDSIKALDEIRRVREAERERLEGEVTIEDVAPPQQETNEDPGEDKSDGP